MTADNVDIEQASAAVPEEIRGWNWGGFFLSWIWGIGNKTWIAFLAFVPFIGWITNIYLGIKGNELAWKNREWQDATQFKATQKKWAIAGVAVFLVAVVMCVAFMALGGMAAYQAFKMGKSGQISGQMQTPGQTPGSTKLPAGAKPANMPAKPMAAGAKTANIPGKPAVAGVPGAKAAVPGHPGPAAAKPSAPGTPGHPAVAAAKPGVKPGQPVKPGAAGKPGVPVKPAVATGKPGMPGAPGKQAALAAGPDAALPISAVLPSAVKMVVDKSWDGTKTTFLRFKFHPDVGRVIVVKIPAEYKKLQMTKSGWISLFEAWGIDKEMELQAAEDKMVNDASDDTVRAMLGMAPTSTAQTATGRSASSVSAPVRQAAPTVSAAQAVAGARGMHATRH